MKKIFLLLTCCVMFTISPVNASKVVFPGENKTLSVPVEKSFNGDKFNYSIKLYETTPKYTVYRLEYPGVGGKVNFGNIITYYYVPSDILKGQQKPRPGVVCLHILGGNGALTKMTCAYFASNGIPAMMCLMPIFHERNPYGSRSKMLKRPEAALILAEAFKQGVTDAIRTVDVMSSRPEVNPAKVNLLGTSLGAITGATVAGRDQRPDKVVLLLGGGDWNKFIGHSRETSSIRQLIDRSKGKDRDYVIAAMDSTDPINNTKYLATRAAVGKLMMVTASDDEVIPAVCSKELAEKCGMKNKMTTLKGLGHYSAIIALPGLLQQFVELFRDSTVPHYAANLTDSKKTAQKFFAQLNRLVCFKPDAGKCFFISADFDFKAKNKKNVKGEIKLFRGNDHKLRLNLSMPKNPLGGEVSRIALGYGKSPWLLGPDKTVYLGSEQVNLKSNPAQYISARIFQYQQMISGILMLASHGMLQPMEKWLRIKVKPQKPSGSLMTISTKKDKLEIYLSDDARPLKMVFKNRKTSGVINFSHWNLSAPANDLVFNPPESKDTKTVKVKQRQLDMMFAALINLSTMKM